MWGIVALASWGAAVLLANISGLVPASVFAAFHASRMEAVTVAQIRAEVADLHAEADRMRRESNLMVQRFEMAEQARNEVTRRVGALEVSVPAIVEKLPQSIAIDRSVTASIVDGNAVSFEAEGGSVRVEQKPLIAIEPRSAEDEERTPLPVADGSAYGIALGFPVAPGDAEALWQEMLARVGTLLIGTWPVLVDLEDDGGTQLVAGPLGTPTQAAQLCSRMLKVGIPCEPTTFAGEPLPLLN